MKLDTKDWTYGAEHEWGDWAYNAPLPAGFGRDLQDHTCMSSNGIANDPSGKSYAFGGEINTPPTHAKEEQSLYAVSLAAWFRHRGSPAPTINHRSNLHLHIRVPGLKDDLDALKRVQAYIHANMRRALAVIQPMPRPADPLNYSEAHEGAVRRWRRRRVSHQTLLTPERLARQLAAPTIDEFFKAEVPQSKGRPQWHLQPRLCVNLRQILETDTIEFRHFAGTLDENVLYRCLSWCEDFLRCAIVGEPIEWLLDLYDGCEWPAFPPYVHHLENRYRATCHDGSLKRPEIEENIHRILTGDFDAYPV